MNQPIRLNNFDLIRLLAASQVIISHGSEWLHLTINPYLAYFIELFPGVAVFFIISGFLVVKSYVDNQGNLKLYALSRILRIYPGLWINLLVIFFLLFITNAFRITDILTYHFLFHLLVVLTTGNILENCPTSLCGAYPFNLTGFYKLFPSGVLWTISVELGFYLLVPLLFVKLIKNKYRQFYLTIGSSIIISLLFALLNSHYLLTKNLSLPAKLMHDLIFPYFWIFCLGALLYVKWSLVSPYITNKCIYWLILYIVLSLACLKIHHDHVLDFNILNFFNIIRLVILACLIISFAYSFQSLNFLTHEIDLSYGMYLYHMLIIYSLLFLGFTHYMYLWIIIFSLTIFTALLSWLYVEKRCLNLKKRLKFQTSMHESILTLELLNKNQNQTGAL